MGIEGITYAGNHGLEILHPDGSKFVHPMPMELQDKVVELLKSLQEQVKKHLCDSRSCWNHVRSKKIKKNFIETKAKKGCMPQSIISFNDIYRLDWIKLIEDCVDSCTPFDEPFTMCIYLRGTAR